jgi:hypothetical protein
MMLRFRAVAVAASFVVAGCATSSISATVGTRPVASVQHIVCERAVHYGSLAQLRRDGS